MQPDAETIMVTAHGNVGTARAAFKRGARGGAREKEESDSGPVAGARRGLFCFGEVLGRGGGGGFC